MSRSQIYYTMYHPNLKKGTGEICMDAFNNSWSPTQKIEDIIKKIASLLLCPLTESPFEPEISNEFSTNYIEWEKNVREFIKYGGKQKYLVLIYYYRKDYK